MRRAIVLLALLGATVVVPAIPSSASWVSNHCSDSYFAMANWRPKDARAYVDVALQEGYEYGGGCWNDNNRDDTPDQPNSGGEGPDCSGLVFKTWGLKNKYGNGGFEWWDPLMNIHGPYASSAFHDVGTTSSVPFYRIPKTDATYMDAFARDGHIGLLYSPLTTGSNTARIAEARGDAYGTDTWEEAWIYNSDYVGVQRKNWTPDCYPSCQRASVGSSEVVKVEP